MKIIEHLKRYCFFWKPSLARRITFYFLIFGLIIFLTTAMLFTIAGRNQFMRSTNQVIQHQLSRLEHSQDADFIWHGIGQPRPELRRFFEVLENLSSSFYSVKDISIYSQAADSTVWNRLYFSDGPILHIERIADPFVQQLERWANRRFQRNMAKIFSSDGSHAIFANITADHDKNSYFLKIGVESEGMTGFIHHQLIHFVLFFLVALFLLRLLGYYFARKIAGPIENLSELSAEVAKGDLSKVAPVTTPDEIGELSKNFNQMIEGLREHERIKMLEFELDKGRRIQKEFLPSSIPHVPNYEIATCFYPAGKVAGDFYDVFTLPDGRIGLVLGDVCDKGVGSALYMALFRSLIRVFATQLTSETAIATADPGVKADVISSHDLAQFRGLNAVAFTNNYIALNHGAESMFATVFFGILDPLTSWLFYINGGHEPLFVISSNMIRAKLMPTGPAVGMMPDTPFRIEKIQLEPGDILMGYTDGVTEARSPKDESFTRKRLQVLVEQPFASASELLERIKSSLFSFIDIAPRGDDVTMLAVQRAGGI
jgi:serine phosphatase RsbU (regulator of sigma subunit)